jgi:hypothetical protein
MRKLKRHEILAIRAYEAKSHRTGEAKSSPVWRGEKRKHIVSQTVDLLRDWRFSPFENEGAVHAGLRSALCLKGIGWRRADAAVGDVIRESFNILGAKRPTWQEGQPEYVTPRENCRWCACPLPDTEFGGLRKGYFCSPECGRAMLLNRDLKTTNGRDVIAMAAFSIIDRQSRPTLICEGCGQSFRSFTKMTGQRYCSHDCASAAARTVEGRDCLTCGKWFRPKQTNKAGKFCSSDCHRQYRYPARACILCGASFRPNIAEASFCSRTCVKKSFKIRSGQIKNISAPVFDYLTYLQSTECRAA